MPFTFKLSKRLALLKASLAASAALALACDRNDLTSPQPSPRPLAAAVTSLSVLSVTASGNDGNVPQNTLDNNLATRWSAYGDGQWIRYDLGALTAIDGVNIAWYLGDSRSAHFDIQVSLDTVTWTTVFSGQSSGLTTQFEPYAFPSVAARYLRIMGHGQWSGPTLLTLWNSITEVAVQGTALPTLSVAAVVASGNDGNVPQNTLDNNLATRWSAYGDGQWIRYDLGALTAIDGVNIAWYLGSPVVNGPSRFDIQVSLDTITWTTVFSGQSSGLTTQFEPYAFPPAAGRYVRIVGHGNSMNAWNSITEVVLYDPPDTATATGTNVPVASVTVSPASVNILVGATVQLTATLKDSAGHVLSGRTVSWTSGDPVVATVSASGLVTGLTVGTATITATSEGVSGAAAASTVTSGSGAPQPGATDTIVFQEGFESGNYSS